MGKNLLADRNLLCNVSISDLSSMILNYYTIDGHKYLLVLPTGKLNTPGKSTWNQISEACAEGILAYDDVHYVACYSWCNDVEPTYYAHYIRGWDNVNNEGSQMDSRVPYIGFRPYLMLIE